VRVAASIRIACGTLVWSASAHAADDDKATVVKATVDKAMVDKATVDKAMVEARTAEGQQRNQERGRKTASMLGRDTLRSAKAIRQPMRLFS
jgi:hypothetical protein